MVLQQFATGSAGLTHTHSPLPFFHKHSVTFHYYSPVINLWHEQGCKSNTQSFIWNLGKSHPSNRCATDSSRSSSALSLSKCNFFFSFLEIDLLLKCTCTSTSFFFLHLWCAFPGQQSCHLSSPFVYLITLSHTHRDSATCGPGRGVCSRVCCTVHRESSFTTMQPTFSSQTFDSRSHAFPTPDTNKIRTLLAQSLNAARL